MKLHLYVAKSKVLLSSSSSSSSLVLDNILIPEHEHEDEDEDEKYQIRAAESALIRNYKVFSTIKLVVSTTSGGADT